MILREQFPLKNQSGQSLVSVLVSVAITAIVLTVVTSMITGMQRETQALTDKLAALDLQKATISAMADGSVCKFILGQPGVTFNGAQIPSLSQPIKIDIPNDTIYTAMDGSTPGPVLAVKGSSASPLSERLKVSEMYVELTSNVGTAFSGNLIIEFDNSKTVRAVRPVSVLLSVNASANVAGATVTSCTGANGGGGSGAPGTDGDWCGAFSWMNNQPNRVITTCKGQTPVCTMVNPGGILGCGAWDINTFCPSGYHLANVMETSQNFVDGGGNTLTITNALYTCTK